MTMKKYMVCCLLPLLAWGCFKDEGNYDYASDIEIKVEGIKENYGSKFLQEKLEITPTVQAVRPEDRCEYLWLIYPEGANSTSVIDTIGREKDLVWIIDVKPGNYQMEFIATDCDRMNFFKRCTTKLTVSTPYTEGWYVLKETAAQATELDLHSPDRETAFVDLLASVHGAAFPGKPDNLGLFFNFKYIDEESGERSVERTLNIVTEDNAYILRTTDLATVRDRSSMFYEMSDDKPYALRNVSMMNNAGLVYLSSHGASFSEGDRFGLPASSVDHPEMGGSPFGFFESIAFQLNLGLFFYFDQNTGTFCTLSPMMGKFKMCEIPEGCNIPHRMVHYGSAGLDMQTFTIKHYALFADKANSSKHYLYQFLYNPLGGGNSIKISEIPAASSLNRADRIVLNKDLGFYYFVADNKLYRYWVAEQRDEPLALAGIPGSEQIVLLKERFYNNTEQLIFNYLVVGTYDGENYRLYFYKTVGGAPAGNPEKTLKGKGKPIDIQYLTSGFVNYNGYWSRSITEWYNEY